VIFRLFLLLPRVVNLAGSTESDKKTVLPSPGLSWPCRPIHARKYAWHPDNDDQQWSTSPSALSLL